MNEKIVITGASGFLGRHIVDGLARCERCALYALSSRPFDLSESFVGKNIVFCHKDNLSGDMLKNATVINCAYPRNSSGTEIADGLKYTQSIFEKAVNSKAAAIINISSQSVYSQQRKEAATEETPVCLESPYAIGKYAVELMLESICKKSGTTYTSLRMASLIGPGFDQRIVNRFVLKLINHEIVTVMRQSKRMGFLDVEDAVSAIFAVLKSNKNSWKSVYNVGSGQGYTAEEIYNTAVSVLGVAESSVNFESGAENSSTAVSFERLNKDTGFVPVVNLNESTKRIAAHLCASLRSEH